MDFPTFFVDNGLLHEQHEPRLENFESQEKLCELINQSKEGLSLARKDSHLYEFVHVPCYLCVYVCLYAGYDGR